MTVAEYACVIRGGTVVSHRGRSRIDLGISEGRVAQRGGEMRGAREIAADGLLVLPGGVDPHVHLSYPPIEQVADNFVRWADDFESGSRCALAGGITTVGNMTFAFAESLRSALDRDISQHAACGISDLFLHPVFDDVTPARLAEVATLAPSGHPSLKIFTCFPEFDQLQATYITAIERGAAAGGMTLFHCEDRSIIECCTGHLVRLGKLGFDQYGASRPIVSEEIAVQRAVAICEVTGAPIYIVHLSSARALNVCKDARARGLPVFVETRPMYLHLTEERLNGPEGPLFTGMPPLRTPHDAESLWRGLIDGDVDTLGSDHAPYTRAHKLANAHTIANVRAGVADLETMLPMLFSEGVIRRGMTLERFVAVTSSNPAKLFGMFPRKGSLDIGADADVVIWDPGATRILRDEEVISGAKYTVYAGFSVQGWPQTVLRRGEVVATSGAIIGQPGSGILTPRTPHSSISELCKSIMGRRD